MDEVEMHCRAEMPGLSRTFPSLDIGQLLICRAASLVSASISTSPGLLQAGTGSEAVPTGPTIRQSVSISTATHGSPNRQMRDVPRELPSQPLPEADGYVNVRFLQSGRFIVVLLLSTAIFCAQVEFRRRERMQHVMAKRTAPGQPQNVWKPADAKRLGMRANAIARPRNRGQMQLTIVSTATLEEPRAPPQGWTCNGGVGRRIVVKGDDYPTADYYRTKDSPQAHMSRSPAPFPPSSRPPFVFTFCYNCESSPSFRPAHSSFPHALDLDFKSALQTSFPLPPSSMQQAMEANAYPWANDTFLAINSSDMNDACALNPSAKWPAFSSGHEHSFPPSNFTMPALVSDSTVERYGQITPPEELSPAVPNSEPLPPTSALPDHMQAVLGWASQQQMQDLANYDPSAPLQHHQQQTTLAQTPDSGRVSKRRRTTTKQTVTNEIAAAPAPQEQTEIPQPPKRKRGRPKSNPQPKQDAMSTEDCPFQVSSARQSHLEKNRVAAHKCRQRRKEYIQGLENRAREYTETNKALKDEVTKLRSDVLELKNVLLSHAGCGCWAIDEYLAQCAGDLLGVSNPFLASGHKTSQQSAAPSVATEPSAREMSTETAIVSAGDRASSQEQDLDGYGGLELINDSDDGDPVGSCG
ncbi:uncharacterized protein EI97DRAFT_439898 [Westerdykella ornata]|uniref:BZIP domain-containing protein n=1 Tax=Westerdykella ornata TaxID=318751 RepID=A0A6A6JSN9_WESOR|nr:uncharacterized protein EI97DRAFT_439898 [Westerdykella ornata]KAF2279572.1 hypothetical protein EI97DRAFT_439898 [Westerdykella ornata]